jgi:hypothetical protein
MRKYLTSLALGLLALLVALPSMGHAMQVYQNKKRPLVVFAPTDQHPAFTRQKAVVNGNRLTLSDRDMVIIYVIGSSVMTELGQGPGMNAAALRSRFRVSDGAFRVLLVGKDGGVKIDTAAPLAMTDLIGEIDRMPMRKDEVRRRQQNQ